MLTLIVIIIVVLLIIAAICAALGVIGEIARTIAICIVLTLVILLIVYFVNKSKRNTITKKKANERLTYEQIQEIARKRANDYIKNTYVFRKATLSITDGFKSNIDPKGKWYSANIETALFPSYVAALLKGKQHEWVVLGIEKGGYVVKMWINKGTDNRGVVLSCDISEVISMCKQLDAYSVFRVHNHPNSDPTHYSTLIASTTDLESARIGSSAVCAEGFNWYDFICSRGDFIQFYSLISNSFAIKGNSTSDIIDIYGITSEIDMGLIDEYYGYKNSINSGFNDGQLKKAVAALSISLVCVLPLTFCNNPLREDKTNNRSSETTIETSSTSSTTRHTTGSQNGVLYEQFGTGNRESESAESLLDSENTSPDDDINDVVQDGFSYHYDTGLEGYVVTTGPNISDVVIPSEVEGVTVVAIGASAFYNHRDITHVTIPNTIMEIRDKAFDWCVDLEDVDFQGSESSLVSIGNYAFECCGLTSITIPEGVVSIGSYAFSSNEGLVSITLPDSLCSIGEYCFRWCDLHSIVIPPLVTSLDENTFMSNHNLEEVNVPSGCHIDLGYDGFLYGCNAAIVEY